MELRDITDDIVTSFFSDNPRACYKGLSNSALVYLYYSNKWVSNPEEKVIGVFNKEELSAVLVYSLINDIMVTLHIYLADRHLKSTKFREVVQAIKDYFKNKTSFKKVIVMAPESCTHVHRAAELFKMDKEGILKDSILWREKLENLIIYGLSI